MTQIEDQTAPVRTPSDRGVTLAFFGFATIAVIWSTKAVMSGQPLEAHLWPIAAGALTMAISGFLLLADRRRAHSQLPADAPARARLPARRLILFSVATVVYVWALDVIGFVLASLVFCAVAQRLVQPVGWVRLVRNSLIFNVVIVLLFVLIMGVATPIGREPFTEIHAFLSQLRYRYF